MAEQHFAKRPRAESGELKQAPSESNWVAFLPIDGTEPVMCNLQTLEYARPALFLQATMDKPATHTPEGIPVHRTSFTKAQLSAFVSSFYVQRLMVTKDVALDELVGIFTQQGVAFTWKGGLPTDDQTIPSGVSVPRVIHTAVASVREACEVLARGLCYWSRLELSMDASLGSTLRPLPDSVDLFNYSGFDCTATRAWVRFQGKPHDAKLAYSEGNCYSLVNDWPFWLERMIRYLSVVYVENKLVGYTETTFLQMTDTAQNSPLHSLWWIPKDVPSHFKAQQASFVTFVKSRLTDNTYTMAAPHQPTLPGFQTRHRENKRNDHHLHFARACIAFCLKTMKEAPDYGALFSGACADADGMTPERVAFAKALEPMGVRVVRWSDDPDKPRKPVNFPPYVKELAHKESTPAVLLEFLNR
jgi:hypothetical protein